MLQSKLIKSITLSVFICWIVAFTLYKSGYFDNYFYNTATDIYHTSHNGGALPIKSSDTVSKIKDTVLKQIRMASSSKVMILTEPAIVSKKDSTPTKKTMLTDSVKTVLDSLRKLEDNFKIMSSSKSSAIFSPAPYEYKASKIEFKSKNSRKVNSTKKYKKKL